MERLCLNCVFAVLAGCGPSMGSPGGIQGTYEFTEEVVEDTCAVPGLGLTEPVSGMFDDWTPDTITVTLPRLPTGSSQPAPPGGLRSLSREQLERVGDGHYELVAVEQNDCVGSASVAQWTQTVVLLATPGEAEATIVDELSVPDGCGAAVAGYTTSCAVERVVDYTQLTSCPDRCVLRAAESGQVTCDCAD